MDEPSRFEVIEKLIQADAFFFWGHGSSSGDLWVNPREALTQDDLNLVAFARDLIGKPKMSMVDVHSCHSVANASTVNLWLAMSQVVYGYPGLTASVGAFPFFLHIGRRAHFTSPIDYDPVDRYHEILEKSDKKK